MIPVLYCDNSKSASKSLLSDVVAFLNGFKPFRVEKIKSTNIDYFEYTPLTQVMVVGFQNGRAYRYTGVPRSIVERFASAPSKGKFLWANVIGKYKYKRIKSTFSDVEAAYLMGEKEGYQQTIRFLMENT